MRKMMKLPLKLLSMLNSREWGGVAEQCYTLLKFIQQIGDACGRAEKGKHQ